jgi:hypothetical protein
LTFFSEFLGMILGAIMNTSHRNPLKPLLGAVLAAGLLATPLAASAQVPGQQQIQGRVTAFDGHYALRVQQPNGEVDAIELHQGTIINPTGLTLAPGMEVTVVGEPQGNVFGANEIDTPYQYTYANPYYGPYWGPYLGYPSVAFGFGFGEGRRFR